MIDIHSKEVLHRDIKPDNILIQTDPEGPHVRILDFGCGDFLQEDPYTSYCGMDLQWTLTTLYFNAHVLQTALFGLKSRFCLHSDLTIFIPDLLNINAYKIVFKQLKGLNV